MLKLIIPYYSIYFLLINKLSSQKQGILLQYIYYIASPMYHASHIILVDQLTLNHSAQSRILKLMNHLSHYLVLKRVNL